MFKKGDKVAVLSSWDNNGTVTIRRAVVHSAGKQLMRLQDEAGSMFKVAFQPEHNEMVKFNGLIIVADASNEALEAEALANGAKIVELNRAYFQRFIDAGDRSHYFQEQMGKLHEPRVRWG